MAESKKAVWWLAATTLIFAIIAIWLSFRGQPPPGDPIVVQPDPVDPMAAYSAYWTIGGDDVEPTYEPPDVKYLNKNAFRKVKQFYARVKKTPSDPVVKISLPDELTASFGHCSDLAPGVLHACTTNADCPASGPICVVSTVRVTTESGTPRKFHWYLKVSPESDEMELEPHPYGNNTKWRSELCGKLVGDITITFNGTTYVVPTGNHAWFWTEQ